MCIISDQTLKVGLLTTLLIIGLMSFCPSMLHAQEEKTFRGFDGGMMIHTGYLNGNIEPIGYRAEGMPVGIGGAIRLHLGGHWRIGTEGYVSTLHVKENGSYVKYGWGGLLGDFYWTFGRFMPYAGLTIGGGGLTDLIIVEEAKEKWTPVGKTYFEKQSFFALDPFVGCDFIVSPSFHLTLKADWLFGIGKDLHMPEGPRLYLGFIFFH